MSLYWWSHLLTRIIHLCPVQRIRPLWNKSLKVTQFIVLAFASLVARKLQSIFISSRKRFKYSYVNIAIIIYPNLKKEKKNKLVYSSGSAPCERSTDLWSLPCHWSFWNGNSSSRAAILDQLPWARHSLIYTRKLRSESHGKKHTSRFTCCTFKIIIWAQMTVPRCICFKDAWNRVKLVASIFWWFCFLTSKLGNCLLHLFVHLFVFIWFTGQASTLANLTTGSTMMLCPQILTVFFLRDLC